MQTAYDGSVIDSHEITYVESDTLSIKLVDNNNLSDHGILKRRWGYSLVYDKNDTERIYSNNIRLNVYTSSDDKFYLKTRKKSQGESRTAARENAEIIDFDVQLIEGELKLDGYFLADADNKFREQKIYVDLYIPINKTVYLDKSTRTFLYDVENIHNIYDRDMADHYFRMTAEGLTCLDCEGYEFNNTDNAESFKMQIDKSGVHIEIQDEGNEKAEVNIDENGILIKSSKDSI
jgi:hypothetical protein